MAGSSRSDGLSTWHAHAFGLALSSQFELAGLTEPAWPANGLPQVTLSLGSEAELRRGFGAGSQPIAWRRGPDGAPVEADLLAAPGTGYLMSGRPGGHFRISRRGDSVRCAPWPDEGWRWQRYLFGRVIPFAATLHGLEPLHASAVELGGAAVALLAAPGVGKTTIAADLVLRGARLIADDVAVVEVSEGKPVLHPGPPLMSVRTIPRPLFGPGELASLGQALGADGGSVRLAVGRVERPLPLRLVYLLRRGDAAPVRLETCHRAEPARLLAATFNFALRDPDRLRRLLDVAAVLAATVAQIRVTVPTGCDLRRLAARIHDDVHERLELRHAG
jgi:hypothetical protein